MKCHCYACGKDFGGLEGFDRHRVGRFVPIKAPTQRRCLAGAELIKSGFIDRGGTWVRPTKRSHPYAKHRQS